MKKFFIFITIFCLLMLYGCGAKENNINDGNSEQTFESFSVSERKIIYTITANIDTDNLDDTLKFIKSKKNADEWIDEESISSNRAYIVLRIKSERIDEFLDSISSTGTMSNLHRTSEDVSLDYQDKTNLINSLNAEMERLIDLQAEASISDLIEINKRITEIDYELANLTKEVNALDSLVNYSKITLNIYGKRPTSELPFGKKMINAFTSGFEALLEFFKFLIIAIAALLPFAIIIVPTFLTVSHYTKKRKKKKTQEEKQ